ncbi:YceI family protein [uncultured Flavobacterium sp.]|jgi:polyisoprenoid-binding protein YceI|uniref:YceI family protein n=1 Tax=uncultured Flavobacterium sp. TaxID=165435 RepID=UPI0030CA5658
MKNLKSIALSLVTLVTVSTTAQTTSKIDLTKSTINWVGKKVTGKHEGTINLKDGALILEEKKLVGGNFTVDMTSIAVTDLEGGMKGKLEGHLKAEDFFGTDKYETSKLVFKKIAAKENGTYTVYAALTIKDKTNEVVFDLSIKDKTATAVVIIDRTKYGIEYGSGSIFDGLGDKAISDDFTLNVVLFFK